MMRECSFAAVLTLALSACTGGGGTLDGRVVGADGGRTCGAPGSSSPGGPCACGTDCASGAVECMPEEFFGYPGGMCIVNCTTDAQCGATGACLQLGAPFMGFTGTCQPSCTTNADCPTGRSCTRVGGRRACFPLCQSDDECVSGHCDPYTTTCTDGTPTTGLAIFERCTRNEECRTGQCSVVDGVCINRCSLARAGCPDDMVCISSAAEEDFGFCAPPCATIEDCAAFPETVCNDVPFPVGIGVCERSIADRSDPCVSGNHTEATAAKVGCNGEPLGGNVPDNQFGGRCTMSPDSCAQPNVCMGGVCYQACEPSVWVNTSTCPSGSRCWQLEDGGVCFPDCRSNTDCASAFCDEFNSCV